MMKVSRTLGWVAGIVTACVLTATSTIAEGRCSASQVRGAYAVQCSGAAAPLGTDLPLLPASGLGTATFDGRGGVVGGQLAVSIGGFHIDQVITGGVGQVQRDCTASVVLDVVSDGVRLPPLSMSGVVLDRGDRILAHSQVPATSATCTLERIGRRQDGDRRDDDDD